MIEVQDEGSQLAALFAGAKPGEQVVDLCAGAGGKTLALAALMENKGQIFATDRRQAPPRADPRPADALGRAQRAGAHAASRSAARSTISPAACDLVLIDAPCTGTGAWRRNPDAKWRVRPGALRAAHQGAGRGARPRRRRCVKPGGRIAYVTCSVLDEENGAQVRAFLARHPEFAVDAAGARSSSALGERAMMFARRRGCRRKAC